MNHDELERQLRAASDGARARMHGCPDEHQLAAYTDGLLGLAERERLEYHLADCDACLALVGVLCRDDATEQTVPAPEIVVAGARAPPARHAHRSLPAAPQWAAAAMLLVALPIVLHLVQSPGEQEHVARTTRNLPDRGASINVLTPTAGMLVDRDSLAVRWTAVPGSEYYDVRIVTESGDVVVQERVSGTGWQPPAVPGLRSGVEYFVQVDAYPVPGKALGSDHVPFRIAD